MPDSVNRFLGDTPARTIIKLLVVSLIVGFFMKIFDIMPLDIVDNIRFFLIDLWETGFQALGRFGTYLVLGGSVVIPVFILIRILSYKR
ncbi:DUF6460 domain-containing protein [Gellertiella hungarica]|uniref:DUF6460 domain-containing protein n=1 Tax=Gellertiella hungarica TaxID=1572859 RepID=A0A7W6J341_9HYPH|nr:DUF6460 domain-containing protein [Gellertiella hungarica]MBB4063916.1 hypothetical protein [Gellertiella hungarica]